MSAFTAKLRTRLGDFELDVEFESSDGGVIGLFGASGSGKTTILRCLAGLHRADTGPPVSPAVSSAGSGGISFRNVSFDGTGALLAPISKLLTVTASPT